MTTVPDDMRTVDHDSDDPDISLEDFLEIEEQNREAFGTWWRAEMAKQPDLFAGEMTLDDWGTQYADWAEGRPV